MLPTQRSLLKTCFFLFSFAILLVSAQEQQTGPPIAEKEINLLKLLEVVPSEESVEFVYNQTQFHLHTLLTEQRHPRTWNLSQRIREDYQAGLRMLFSVDEDIVRKLQELSLDQSILEIAVQAMEDAFLEGKKIYIYGCGATGRLAKQMEGNFWRPFWKRVQSQEKIWEKIRPHLKIPVEEQLIGEMTGADRAFVNSLDGFEDLPAIGQLQLEDRKIRQGDVVICISASGTASSVIGTMQAALNQWQKTNSYSPEETRKKLFFIYNNPDEQLNPLNRSRRILNEPGITKINLTTGPQSLAGATCMQAATIETFVLGHILQSAIDRALRRFLSKKDMSKLGFKKRILLPAILSEFKNIWESVQKNIPDIAKLTALETETYASHRFSTYFAAKGLSTVFIDSTERSLAFRLFPMDTVERKKRECWIQVWTPAANTQEAWRALLGRPFRGLDFDFYQQPLTDDIKNPTQKNAALLSLVDAGNDRQSLYDFSFSPANKKDRGPQAGDLGVAVCLSPEEAHLNNENSDIRQFMRLCWDKGSRLALIIISDKSKKNLSGLVRNLPGFDTQRKDVLVTLSLDNSHDPMGINQQIALKIILNAHSTAVMTRLGRVTGNTMTHVTPHNLKLIGRATHLIQSQVNDTLTQPAWVKQCGLHKPISYGEANAVLFDSMAFLKRKRRKADQAAEAALTIIRILETLRLRTKISLEKAFDITQKKGLSTYLNDVISHPKSSK